MKDKEVQWHWQWCWKRQRIVLDDNNMKIPRHGWYMGWIPNNENMLTYYMPPIRGLITVCWLKITASKTFVLPMIKETE